MGNEEIIKPLKDLEELNQPGSFILMNKGVRILQVFRVEDVLNWNIEIGGNLKDGLALELVFNDKSPNNQNNYSRFCLRTINSDFVKVDLKGGEIFHCYFPRPVDFRSLSEVIYWVVKNVYCISSDEDFEWGLIKE